MMRYVLLALCVAPLFGCGGGNARCDMRPSTPQCTDWRGSITPTWITQEALCKTLSGTGVGGMFASGETCPTADMWGGCQATQGDGSKQTNWYYKGDKYKTLADAQSKCDSGMSWIDPQ
ncbi:MAG: hypothetical protein JNM83_24330 [Myxococcales bacterium]|jgi:hypothetical protein|nr:hypothetical protein [Myxococcales bacterium]